MNQLGKPHGSLGVSPHNGLISPAYFVCAVAPQIHPRFLHHLVRTRLYISEYERRGKWMPPSQFDISWSEVRDIPIVLPLVDQQRAIADFLDAETARIDALIAKKSQLAKELAERYWVGLAASIAACAGPDVQLRRCLLSLVDGPFGSALKTEHYSESGARVVRLGNIGAGAFQDSDHAFIPHAYFEQLRRHQVRQGDILIAGLGDENHHAGRACVAPDLGPAIVKADCYCGRVDTTRALPQYLALYLSSPLGLEALAHLTRGSTRARINLDVAKSVRVLLPDLATQSRVVNGALELRSLSEATNETIATQVLRLHERRQAVITAAVTGQLQIPGAA